MKASDAQADILDWAAVLLLKAALLPYQGWSKHRRRPIRSRWVKVSGLLLTNPLSPCSIIHPGVR